MTQHQLPAALVLGAQTPVRRSARPAPWRTRLAAKVFAGRYDLQLEACVPVQPGSALAVHAGRLTTSREREELARSLRSALRHADEAHDYGITTRMPVQSAALAAAEDLIDQVTLRLHAPAPVRARGMARLRLLLADGVGPLYRAGRIGLRAELRGVLAAL
jgi:hypothetical protein